MGFSNSPLATVKLISPKDPVHPDGDVDPVHLLVAARTPRAVLLLDTQADGAIVPHNVVAGGPLAAGLKHLAPPLGGHLADKAVNGDGVDGVVPPRR